MICMELPTPEEIILVLDENEIDQLSQKPEPGTWTSEVEQAKSNERN
jgi:hypothetical protein